MLTVQEITVDLTPQKAALGSVGGWQANFYIPIISPIILDNGKNPLSALRLNDLFAKIKTLIKFAHAKHELCIQETGNKEIITNLTTSEFSFYTKQAPLSVNEYDQLINMLSIEMSALPSNIHLILASFPVKWCDEKTNKDYVHNCVLQAISPNNYPVQQSLKMPRIYNHVKRRTSIMDYTYGYVTSTGTLVKYLSPPTDGSYSYSLPVTLKNNPCLSQDDSLHQHEGALLVHANGEKYFKVVDICVDHVHGQAQQDLFALIEKLSKNKTNTTLPEVVSHVITSASVKERHKYMLTEINAHADPHSQFVSKTKISPAQETLSVNGVDASVRIFPPEPIMTSFDLEFLHKIDDINNQNKRLNKYKLRYNTEYEQQEYWIHKILDYKLRQESTVHKRLERAIKYTDLDNIRKKNAEGQTPIAKAINFIQYLSKIGIDKLHQQKDFRRKHYGYKPPLSEKSKLESKDAIIAEGIRWLEMLVGRGCGLIEITAALNDQTYPEVQKYLTAAWPKLVFINELFEAVSQQKMNDDSLPKLVAPSSINEDIIINNEQPIGYFYKQLYNRDPTDVDVLMKDEHAGQIDAFGSEDVVMNDETAENMPADSKKFATKAY